MTRAEVRELVGLDTFEMNITIKRTEDIDPSNLALTCVYKLGASSLREMMPDCTPVIHTKLSAMFFGVGK